MHRQRVASGFHSNTIAHHAGSDCLTRLRYMPNQLSQLLCYSRAKRLAMPTRLSPEEGCASVSVRTLSLLSDPEHLHDTKACVRADKWHVVDLFCTVRLTGCIVCCCFTVCGSQIAHLCMYPGPLHHKIASRWGIHRSAAAQSVGSDKNTGLIVHICTICGPDKHIAATTHPPWNCYRLFWPWYSPRGR